MKYYSYIIVRDFGFAPNPFGKHCTLATCKPSIRNTASVGDWIIGTGAAQNNESGKLVYIMQVNKKITFDQYWNSPEFQYKKPLFNGSLKQKYGDNIYYFDSSKNEWIQANSHHSNPNGTKNEYNFKRDLRSKYVLISELFWYFGENSINIPEHMKKKVCNNKQGHIYLEQNDFQQLFEWVKAKYQPGYHGHPMLFDEFTRYDGVS